MSCEHEHHHSHQHTPPIPTNASQSLYSKIDTAHVEVLNLQNPSDEWGQVFKDANHKYDLKPVLKSDADCQMIVRIPFISSHVKLFSIILRTNGDKYCPKTIKVWKNDKNIDFDNVNSKKPAHSISHPHIGVNYNDDEVPEVLEDDSDFVEHYLPRHKFTGVQHLTLFIEDIHGDEDESHIHSIELRGEATELTKDPVISIYELAANPQDHKSITLETSQFSMGL